MSTPSGDRPFYMVATRVGGPEPDPHLDLLRQFERDKAARSRASIANPPRTGHATTRSGASVSRRGTAEVFSRFAVKSTQPDSSQKRYHEDHTEVRTSISRDNRPQRHKPSPSAKQLLSLDAGFKARPISSNVSIPQRTNQTQSSTRASAEQPISRIKGDPVDDRTSNREYNFCPGLQRVFVGVPSEFGPKHQISVFGDEDISARNRTPDDWETFDEVPAEDPKFGRETKPSRESKPASTPAQSHPPSNPDSVVTAYSRGRPRSRRPNPRK